MQVEKQYGIMNFGEGQITQKEYALFMHFDKIYAGFCGYNGKTNKGNSPKKPGNLGIVTVLKRKSLPGRRQHLQKRSKTNKSGLDKIDKIF